MSNDVAESTDCRMFQHSSAKAYVAEMSYDQLIDRFCHVIVHNLFAYIEERSNEPLRHYRIG